MGNLKQNTTERFFWELERILVSIQTVFFLFYHQVKYIASEMELQA